MAIPAQKKHALPLVREEEALQRIPQQAVRRRNHRAQLKKADRVCSEAGSGPVGLAISSWCGSATETTVDAQLIGVWRRLARVHRRICRFVAGSFTPRP
jgi:hypothetical protein